MINCETVHTLTCDTQAEYNELSEHIGGLEGNLSVEHDEPNLTSTVTIVGIYAP